MGDGAVAVDGSFGMRRAAGEAALGGGGAASAADAEEACWKRGIAAKRGYFRAAASITKLVNRKRPRKNCRKKINVTVAFAFPTPPPPNIIKVRQKLFIFSLPDILLALILSGWVCCEIFLVANIVYRVRFYPALDWMG